MADDQPTTAEILRRLDEIARSQQRLLETMERSYVRKEVYEARHDSLRSGIDQRIGEVEKDVDEIKSSNKAASDRLKQLGFSLATSIIMMLIVAAFTISNFMARGGA